MHLFGHLKLGEMFLEHCDWKGLPNQIVESLLVAILTWKEHHNTTYSPEKCWCHRYTKEKAFYWENFATRTLHQPPATISKKHWLKDCNWGKENPSNNADRMWKTHFYSREKLANCATSKIMLLGVLSCGGIGKLYFLNMKTPALAGNPPTKCQNWFQ